MKRKQKPTSFRVPDPVRGPVTVRFDPRRRRWYARFRDPVRKRRVSRMLGPDQSQAIIEANKLAEKLKRGELERDPSRMQARALLDDYLADRRRRGAADKQVRAIKSACRRFLGFLGAETVDDVTHDGLDRWLDHMGGPLGLAGSTLNKHRGHVQGWFRWARGNRRITDDPVLGVALRDATLKRRVRRAETADVLERILEAAERPPEYDADGGVIDPGGAEWEPLAYRIAMLAGLRQGEILRLCWAHIDFERGAYVLREWEQKAKRHTVTALRPDLLAALQAHRLAQTERLGRPPRPEERVLRIKAPTRRWQLTLVAARVPYRDSAGRVFDWHAMRHTFCTLLGKGGGRDGHRIRFAVQQALMRHATPAQTMEYTHEELEDQQKAFEE